MEEVFQNGNYQREANANMTAVETRKEVKEALARFFTRVRLWRIDKSLALIAARLFRSSWLAAAAPDFREGSPAALDGSLGT